LRLLPYHTSGAIDDESLRCEFGAPLVLDYLWISLSNKGRHNGEFLFWQCIPAATSILNAIFAPVIDFARQITGVTENKEHNSKVNEVTVPPNPLQGSEIDIGVESTPGKGDYGASRADSEVDLVMIGGESSQSEHYGRGGESASRQVTDPFGLFH